MGDLSTNFRQRGGTFVSGRYNVIADGAEEEAALIRKGASKKARNEIWLPRLDAQREFCLRNPPLFSLFTKKESFTSDLSYERILY
jgi:hypothetical protein